MSGPMKSTNVVLIISLLSIWGTVMQTSAYTYTKVASEYKEQCKDEVGEVHSVGESWTYEKRCELATCTSINGKLYEEVLGCVKVAVQSGCKLTPRLGTAYPSCCPIVRCNNNTHNDQ